MKLRLEDKLKAVNLRRKGLTYKEIRDKISGLSKGTLSGWLKYIELSEKQKLRIINKVKTASEAGRIKGAWVNRIKAQKRIESITSQAIDEFSELAKDPRFLIGLSLYWAEGTKASRNFQFINSDSIMIKTMMSWLREVCHIDRDQIGIRIYAHKIYAHKHPEKYWATIIGIPATDFKRTVYKPTPWTVKKNPIYMGCCRVELRGSDFYWKVIAWIKELEKTFFAPVA